MSANQQPPALLRRVVLILLLLAWGAASHAGDTLRIAIGQKQAWGSSFFIPVVAVEQGFFADEDIEVETVFTRGGAETVQAVLSGNLDLGSSTGILSVVSAYGRGAPLRILAADTTGVDDLYWYVKNSSSRHATGDLRGATIGFTRPGSSTHLSALELLQQFGIDAELVSCGGIPDCYTMVRTGQLEVGVAGVPFFLDQIRGGELRIVARGGDLPRFSDQTVRVFFSRAELLERNSDLVQRFFRAYQRAVDWSYDHPDQALARYAEYNDMPLETVRTIPEFAPKQAYRLAPVGKLELTLQQAQDHDFLDRTLTPTELDALLQTSRLPAPNGP